MQATIEIMKTDIQAIASAIETRPGARQSASSNMTLKLGGSSLNQLRSNWNARNKCLELSNFQVEVNNIFLTYNYSVCKTKSTNNWELSKQRMAYILYRPSQMQKSKHMKHSKIDSIYSLKYSYPGTMKPSSPFNIENYAGIMKKQKRGEWVD